jgi:hypothetical protein
MQPLLHIGYHKTGTTFLQKRVFPKPGFALVAKTKALWSVFVKVEPFRFDARDARETFWPRIEEAGEKNLMPVLSAERLSGSPHSGGYDSEQIADRLAATFPGTQVLVVIREQTDMLVSAYKQYLKRGGPGTLRQYAASPSEAPRMPRFDPRFFEYHRLIGRYQNLFGTENVLVLPYELLKNTPRAFLMRIGDFAGVTVTDPKDKVIKPSPSALSLSFKRQANRWVVRDDLNPAPPFEVEGANRALLKLSHWTDARLPLGLRERHEFRLRALAAELTEGQYAESNATTAELTGIDLSSLGYPCG